jgi:hypothetical protein
MTVIRFPTHPPTPVDDWDPADREAIAKLCGPHLKAGEIIGYESGVTECGDPQVYLIGPAPEHDCILCISRLGRLYLLEDGRGQLLGEYQRIAELVDRAGSTLAQKRNSIAVRAIGAWYAAREFFEEKLEPLLAEPAELLSHVAPQLAAFA